MTEEQFGRMWRDLVESEGHKARLPGQFREAKSGRRSDKVMRLLEALPALFEDGVLRTDIARMFKVSDVTVTNCAKELGLSFEERTPKNMRKRDTNLDDVSERIYVAVVHGGMTHVEAAHEFGCSRGSVWRIVSGRRKATV